MGGGNLLIINILQKYSQQKQRYKTTSLKDRHDYEPYYWI